MSVSTDIVRFFLTQEPGKKFSAGEVQSLGGFTTSQNVYAVLAIIAQPGNPLMRERESGVYQYRIRPGFDVQAWLRGSMSVPKREQPEIPSFTKSATEQSLANTAPSKEGAGAASAAAPKTAAAQAPCAPRTSSPGLTETSDSANGRQPASPDKSDSGTQPASAAALAGMAQVYDQVLVDLKARRHQLDAAIDYIESVVIGRKS